MIKKESILCFLFHFIELSKAGLPNRMNLIHFLILCNKTKFWLKSGLYEDHKKLFKVFLKIKIWSREVSTGWIILIKHWYLKHVERKDENLQAGANIKSV